MSRTLFILRVNRHLSADRWQRFIEKTRAAGTTPGQVLYAAIAAYVGDETHDEQTSQADKSDKRD